MGAHGFGEMPIRGFTRRVPDSSERPSLHGRSIRCARLTVRGPVKICSQALTCRQAIVIVVGRHLSGYLMHAKLAGLLLMVLAVVVAVAILRGRRCGNVKVKGTHRVLGDRDRPMTEWADEWKFERP